MFWSTSGISRRHRIALGVVLLLQVLMPVFAVARYHVLQRPALVARGAMPCAAYRAAIAPEKPDGCDLALLSRSGDEVDETYYGKHGAFVTVVRSTRGAWHSSEEINENIQWELPFPFAAFILVAVARLHKAVRTKSLVSWPFARHPDDEFERLLFFYAVPVFLLSFAMLPLTSYLWLAIG